MSIKEKPFLDSVEKLGALPGFWFSNPVVSGFLTIAMCVLFGAVGALFLTGFAGGVPLEQFEVARMGAIFALGVAAFALFAIAVGAMRESDEARHRLLFVFGGALCLASLVAFDVLGANIVREWLAPMGQVIGTTPTRTTPP